MVNDYDFINAHKSGAPSSTTLQARRLVLRHTAASTKPGETWGGAVEVTSSPFLGQPGYVV